MLLESTEVNKAIISYILRTAGYGRTFRNRSERQGMVRMVSKEIMYN